MLHGFGYERAEPVSPLIIVNAATIGLILLLADGAWGRVAATVTLTLALWLGLYATLSLVHWRNTTEHVERITAARPEEEKFWDRRLDALPKRMPPPYRPLVRADLDQIVARSAKDHEATLKFFATQAVNWRNTFFLSFGSAVLCAAGASVRQRRIRRREEIVP